MSDTSLIRVQSNEPDFPIFDPGSIDAGLLRDLPGTLRALADAIESGQIEARNPRAEGCGLVARHDHRANIRVSFHVAAEVFPGRKELA